MIWETTIVARKTCHDFYYLSLTYIKKFQFKDYKSHLKKLPEL